VFGLEGGWDRVMAGARRAPRARREADERAGAEALPACLRLVPGCLRLVFGCLRRHVDTPHLAKAAVMQLRPVVERSRMSWFAHLVMAAMYTLLKASLPRQTSDKQPESVASLPMYHCARNTHGNTSTE